MVDALMALMSIQYTLVLDYTKAFDKVDNCLLLKKMKRYGFHEKLIIWIEYSLAYCPQQLVVLNGTLSYVTAIISGVPQGTGIRPL